MSEPNRTTETGVWRNGARVGPNRQRLKDRVDALLAMRSARERPKPNEEAVAMCRRNPKKGWARRYIRAFGMSFNG